MYLFQQASDHGPNRRAQTLAEFQAGLKSTFLVFAKWTSLSLSRVQELAYQCESDMLRQQLNSCWKENSEEDGVSK